MRIEEVNSNNIKDLTDEDLLYLRERCSQLFTSTRKWAENVRKGLVGLKTPLPRDVLTEAYTTIALEARERGLKPKRTELDKRAARLAMRGIDVADMPGLLLKESVVTAVGPIVTGGPQKISSVDIRVDAPESGDQAIDYGLEKRIAEIVTRQSGKPVVVRRDGEGIDGPVIPLYDLVLLPRTQTQSVPSTDLVKRMASSITTLEYVKTASDTNVVKSGERIILTTAPAGEFVDLEEVPCRSGEGVKVMYGFREGSVVPVVQSLRFDADVFTAESATDWAKKHATGVEVSNVVLTPKTEEPTQFIKNEAERIVGGLVYKLNDPDSEGDFIDDPQDIWEGLKSWMLNGQTMKIMHAGRHVVTPLLECFQADDDTVKGAEVVPKGAWYISAYVPEDEDELWDAVKRGDITGFSMAGSAAADPVG